MALSRHSPDLFDYKPERLALRGYRCAMAGYDLGDPACWDDLWTTMTSDGGLEFACRAMGSLQNFVRSIRGTMDCKGRYFPMSCRGICRDESLALTLLSAQQHGDEVTLDYCLEKLLSDGLVAHGANVAAAAKRFANDLSESRLLLLPVPLAVIRDVVESRCRDCKASVH